MRSITTGDRCGSRTRQQHSPATDPEHHAHPAGITECVTEPGKWPTLVELVGAVRNVEMARLGSYNRRSRNFESSLTFRDRFWRRNVGVARSTAQRQRT